MAAAGANASPPRDAARSQGAAAALDALARALGAKLAAPAVDALLAPLRAELAAAGSVDAKDVARALEQLEDVMDALFLLDDRDRRGPESGA